ncbi:DUF4424 domain-containing protein [Oricola sp.]|uniref:DUF4424 domain-containing protein n=1 Tax=Oricola sp. TaxID=1979950 RepID=UPI003BAC7CA3
MVFLSQGIRGLIAAVLLCAGIMPAQANDSMAEIGAGGLVLARSDLIAMEKETLYLSMDEVRVDYVFRNDSDRVIETVVAFPMPDIKVDPYGGDWAIPRYEDNFLGFSVEAGGRRIEPRLQQRAYAAGVDVTAMLEVAGIGLSPLDDFGSPIDTSGLSQAAIADLVARGVVFANRDAATGRYIDPVEPAWTLKTTYWWTMTFPANAEIAVRHRYQPAVGGSAGLFFLTGDPAQPVDSGYVQDYCMDRSFLNAVERRQKTADANSIGYTEARLSYVLTTGANWAGPIGDFRLVVDKGSTKNLVSFCGEGVKKTGPTTFEMRKKDFWPERDMHVLFVVGHSLQ